MPKSKLHELTHSMNLAQRALATSIEHGTPDMTYHLAKQYIRHRDQLDSHEANAAKESEYLDPTNTAVVANLLLEGNFNLMLDGMIDYATVGEAADERYNVYWQTIGHILTCAKTHPIPE